MRLIGIHGSKTHCRCRNCGAEESHPAPDQDRLIQISQDDGTTGICLACGEEQGGVEPDAHSITCDTCGRQAVAGVDYALLTFLS